MMKVLHLYAQDSEHGEAYIVGNQEALMALRDSIDEVLASGSQGVEMIPADGEGYSLNVVQEDSDWQSSVWQGLEMPYQDEIARASAVASGHLHHPSSLFRNKKGEGQ